ncbi:MAG: hypothetical protein QM778_06400 [Myxococcales bacterium]
MEVRTGARPGTNGAAEVLVHLSAPPERVPLATAIRSTTLISSQSAVERAGKLRLYQQALPREYAETLGSLVAATWLPMDVGMVHYATVSQLGFSDSEARENGRHVAQRVQNSHFAVLVRALGQTVTPWSVLPRLPAFLGRLVQGGECSVVKLGPKDARVELHGIDIARFKYVREGWAGMLEGTLELLVRKVYARDLSPADTQSVAVFSLAWV